MKAKVNPLTAIVAIAALVLVVGFIGWKFVSAEPANGYPPPPPQSEIDKIHKNGPPPPRSPGGASAAPRA